MRPAPALRARAAGPGLRGPRATGHGAGATRSGRALACALAVAPWLVTATAAEPVDPLQAEVSAAETAFAQSMAERDFARFGSFVADDAVFLGGGKPQRGKAAVLAAWQRFFQGPQAPFSWRPALVAVLPSGGLAQSTGPVFAPGGQLIGHFYSTWRREPDGRWRVVLDNGYDACECAAAAAPAGSAAAPAAAASANPH
jgi:ketosteroid isomerase-like protein